MLVIALAMTLTTQPRPQLDRLETLASALESIDPFYGSFHLMSFEHGVMGICGNIFAHDGLTLDIAGIPNYAGKHGPDAVEWFLGLSHPDAVGLLTAAGYPQTQWYDPKAVARKIRYFVEARRDPVGS